jgi:hypothetical protein
MKRILIGVSFVLSLVSRPAFAELRELKQSIYGMD